MVYRLLGLIFFLFILPGNLFAHTQTQMIEMTPVGFEPDTVILDQNSTVIFVNKDSKPRWPASNVHPTHDLYPEFDPKKPIEPGQSWPFKFTKVGEWKFHDHLSPHIRGKVTVEAEEGVKTQVDEKKETISFFDKIGEFLSGILDKIKQVLNLEKPKQVLGTVNLATLSPDEQIKVIKQMADDLGVKQTWQRLKEVFKGQAGSSGNIHDLAHLTGSLIYDNEGLEGLSICSPEFAFGCYHGFLDTAFAKNLDQLEKAQQGCLEVGPPNTGPVASCIHGIGHGVASFYLTKDLKSSLATCERLTTGQEFCFDGVFMEFVRSSPEGFFKKEDPLYPCNALESEFGTKYSFACGRNQVTAFLKRLGFDFDQVINICLSNPSLPFQNSCFDSLGFVLASKGEEKSIIEGCRRIGEPSLVARCATAAAGELIFQEVPGWQDKSPAICNSLSPQQITSCHEHINRLIKEYSKEVRLPDGQVKKNFSLLKAGDDPNTYIRKQLKVCFDIAGRDGCYKDAAKLLFNQFGLRDTLQYLKANEDYQEVYARCHEVTHYLSRLEYEKQREIAKVYAQCDSTCHGGCYHGTLEAFLKEKQLEPDTDLYSEFTKICGGKGDYQKPIEFNECLHGLGHAAMFVYDMELPISLKLCDTLEGQDPKERCYSGAFMENSSSSTSFDHASIYIKSDDPFYPCNALEEQYQPLCWQYQSSYFSIINKQDWNKVSNLCLQIPEKYHDRCFRTIGTNQVGFTNSLGVMRDNCSKMPDEHFQAVCMAGVISSLSYRFVGNSQKMVDFCSLVPSKHQETCFKQMGTSLLDWSTNKNLAKETCNKIADPQSRSWCTEVI